MINENEMREALLETIRSEIRYSPVAPEGAMSMQEILEALELSQHKVGRSTVQRILAKLMASGQVKRGVRRVKTDLGQIRLVPVYWLVEENNGEN